MKGFRSLVAFIAVAGPCAAARAEQLYRFVDLHLPTTGGTWISNAAGAQAVGSGDVGTPTGTFLHALLWPAGAPSAIDLNPSGFRTSFARGTDGVRQVGAGIATGGENYEALLWDGSADSVRRLAPMGYLSSGAQAVSGEQQVGFGIRNGAVAAHALLWNGGPDQVIDLNPVGFADSHATGVATGQQVGYGTPLGLPGVSHALLWNGTRDNFVDLNPQGFSKSEAQATDGISQVGAGVLADGASHAVVWHSSARDFVDLNPSDRVNSVAFAVRGNLVVGETSNPYFGSHAAAWIDGIPTDLSQFVPPNYDLSAANGIDSQGDIYGWVEDEWVNHTAHAAEWVPVPEPAVLAWVAVAAAALLGRRAAAPGRHTQ